MAFDYAFTEVIERGQAPLLRVVIGSRCLDDAADSRAWGKRQVWDWMRPWPADRTLFMSGYARGPDRWGSLAAQHLGIHRLELKLDGRRWLDGRPAKGVMAKWTLDPPPAKDAGREEWKQWCLARDRAMGLSACGAVGRGWDVSVLALIAPWSDTGGTEYSLEFFSHQSIAVDARMAPTSLRPHRE